MSQGRIEKRLEELGISLPDAPPAVANYVSVKRSGQFVVTSGQLPWVGDKLFCEGRLGEDVTVEQGYQAARQCAINAIAQLKLAAGDLDNIQELVRVEGFVHCGSGFRDHPQVLNGASDLFVEVFGDAGRHARMALGIHEMPLNSPVQLGVWAAMVEYRD
jgi:enamine deaminase RidA (YjgF/YER057c/UK114 family)